MSDHAPSPTQIKADDQRPEHPDFWCKRFGAGTTPWDAGKVPDDFAQFVAARTQSLRTLIPGCGSGWEATVLAERGWRTTALDFSPTAVDRAQAILAPLLGPGSTVDLVCGDFFQWQPEAPLDLIYERAFLCALPRKLWDDWAQRVAALLPPGALLAGYFFVCDQPKGPPFGILPEQLDALLSPHFRRIENRAVADSIPVFAGRERWQVWQRKD